MILGAELVALSNYHVMYATVTSHELFCSLVPCERYLGNKTGIITQQRLASFPGLLHLTRYTLGDRRSGNEASSAYD